jgi:subtilase family serine protease
MIKKSVIAAIIFGIASLAGLSICVRSPFAVGNAVMEENDRVVLHGTVPPKARPEFDVGPTDPSLPMKRTILLLKIAPEKQAELDRLVAEQQDPSSPNFHRWLTPEDFGKRFGRTPEEIATVKGWLITHGFTIDETAKGGTWINFSGTAADVDLAFHANMHDYQVDGLLRHANSTDPSIPRALSDLVAGPVSLHNFPHKTTHTPPRHMPETTPQPGYTESDGSHDLAPGDFAAIYDVNSVYNMGYDGAGVTIAVVERTHPDAAKWNVFRSTFGLPYNPPVVKVNGTDPGDLGPDEDAEADLDVEWAGAVATGATINFVTSASTNSADGVDLSSQYIVDNNLASIMSNCFETCEPDLGTTWSAFYYNLWEQAASQGITVFVVSGDSGAYACTNANGVPGGGKAVNGLASTPFNIAVGGTTLSDASAYWSTDNSAYGVSALNYMPEAAWNNWGQYGLYLASGGGPSVLWPKPAWQRCPGVPNNGARNLPDVSLDADPYTGYRIYTCTNSTGICSSNSWSVIGGTSAASPSLASLMALIVQSTGGQRQGNFNSAFYQLGNAQYSGASGAIAVFHDITSGGNGFGASLPGYSCTAH